MRFVSDTDVFNPQATNYKEGTFRTDMGQPNPATLIGCILYVFVNYNIFFLIDRKFTQEYDGFVRFVTLFDLAKLYLKI